MNDELPAECVAQEGQLGPSRILRLPEDSSGGGLKTLRGASSQPSPRRRPPYWLDRENTNTTATVPGRERPELPRRRVLSLWKCGASPALTFLRCVFPVCCSKCGRAGRARACLNWKSAN